MRRTPPPLNWFRVFEASARHLKFTHAAVELGMTQSAVSQQIRAFEARLGVQLFVRKPRGLALSDAGRKLVPKIEAALNDLDAAGRMFDPKPKEGLVTIACSVSIAQWIIAPHLAQFHALHPSFKLRMLSMVWPDEFASASADVELRFGSQKQVGQGAQRLPDRLIAVASSAFAGSLTTGPLIESVGTLEGWSHYGQAAKMAPLPAPHYFVDSYGMALNLAQQGVGIALVSSILAQNSVALGQLQVMQDIDFIGQEGYFLAQRPDSAPAQAFVQWFKGLLSA